jgi:repressor LexA
MSILRDKRKAMGLNQEEFGALFHVDQTTVSKWETGSNMPNLDQALAISAEFEISLDLIYNNPLSFGPLCIPVYSQYYRSGASGSRAEQSRYYDANYREIAYYMQGQDTPSGMLSDEDILSSYLAISVSGNAMEPRFCDGDLVLIRKSREERDGLICAVCVDNDPARLFRIMLHKNGLSLLSLNPAYPPIFIPRSEIDSGRIMIVGQAVGFRGRV